MRRSADADAMSSSSDSSLVRLFGSDRHAAERERSPRRDMRMSTALEQHQQEVWSVVSDLDAKAALALHGVVLVSH